MLVRFWFYLNWFYLNLGTPGRLAGAERGSRVLQITLNFRCERVRTTKHTPRDPFRGLERRHGLAEIVERGAVVSVEHPRVFPPHPEREFATLSKSASRHGHLLAQQRLGFFEAPQMIEGRCIVEGGHVPVSYELVEGARLLFR